MIHNVKHIRKLVSMIKGIRRRLFQECLNICRRKRGFSPHPTLPCWTYLSNSRADASFLILQLPDTAKAYCCAFSCSFLYIHISRLPCAPLLSCWYKHYFVRDLYKRHIVKIIHFSYPFGISVKTNMLLQDDRFAYIN